ncbi:MAG: ester cyclase [Thermoleophilia bacterium]|nr:ester cyclase [Thermoleophilia bacterium]
MAVAVCAELCETATRVYQHLSDGDLDKASSYLSDDVEWHDFAFDVTFHSAEEMRPSMEEFTKSFSDFRIEVTNLVEGDESVAVEYTIRGTHTGPMTTPQGEIPATGRSVELHCCDVLHFDSQGKIDRANSYYDTSELGRQLGMA